MLLKTLELSREGIHGIDGTVVTKQNLEQIAENYESNSAPITTEKHFAENAPAVGIVKKIWTAPSTKNKSLTSLYGIVEYNDLVASDIEKKHFPGWSIGARKNGQGQYYLHHLKLCGAVPPAVKGLQDLGSQFISLSDIQKCQYFYLSDSPETEETDTAPEETGKDDQTLIKELQEKIQILEEENQKLKTELQELAEKYPEENISLSDTDLKTKKILSILKEKNTEELKALVKTKAIYPYAHDFVLALSDTFPLTSEIKLSDGRHTTQYDLLKDILNAIPDQVWTSEVISLNDRFNKNEPCDFSQVINKG